MRASDLHFEPYEYHYRVRFRVDGELREITQPPIAIKDKLSSRIKVISRLDIAEKRVPQDGRMKLKFGAKAIDFRVSTLPTLFGEKIVIRILDPSSAKVGIEALGYEKIEKDRLLKIIQRPYGMVLVTGPTGSGKTVSLYTCLNILNQPGVNIATVEDPAEINFAGREPGQRERQGRPEFRGRAEVVPASGSGHHHGRRNPRPGDCRHRDQGRANRPHGDVDAAHQRCADDTDSPVEHGRGAVQHRVQHSADHGPAPGAQALRDLQGAGRLPARGDAQSGLRSASDLDGTWRPYRAVGCSACNNGYKGRVGIYQVMPITEEIQKIILNEGTSMDIAQQAQRESVRDLRQSGLIKVRSGVTTLEEVISVTNE